MPNALSVSKDLTLHFGDRHDGVIGVPAITADGQVIEVSYFFGDAKPKNIIVISSQAGCPMSCAFCELGSEKFVRNLTGREMCDQVSLMLVEAALYGFGVDDVPHKVTVANTGEPLLNPALVDGLASIAVLPVSFKVSTILPASGVVTDNLRRLAEFAAQLSRPVQLQISLISTSERQRRDTAGARLADLGRVRSAAELWRNKDPNGRKVNISLILSDETIAEAEHVCTVLPPELVRFRFREYVPTVNGGSHGLLRISPARLREIKDCFGERGYETGDWASPTPTERRFGLAGNVIRRMYLDMLAGAR